MPRIRNKEEADEEGQGEQRSFSFFVVLGQQFLSNEKERGSQDEGKRDFEMVVGT